MNVKLKICGMKQPSNIAEVAALRPDYLGFIFYKGSKRYVEGLAPSSLDHLPEEIKRTGVFVNEDLNTIKLQAEKFRLKAIQLHGDESPEFCKQLKTLLPEIEVIKAFGIHPAFIFEDLVPYTGKVDFFLFDTQTKEHGGSGRVFNWSLLQSYRGSTPYFLSGGIGLEQTTELQAIEDERLYAIDVNSRFEKEPGLKDLDRLKQFKRRLSGIPQ
jgi:phosphoribosylanthranilate isomerase